ncbi:hypothetical protein F5B19DRAFT_489404 [Rostrohypoxylon terebratum]|nr:hypothetical protein F5B19DRAFT_489404 [Rostrohypoxylon terebratum]
MRGPRSRCSLLLLGATNAACPARATSGFQATDEVAHTDLKASFNATAYTFDAFKQQYNAVYTSLTRTYQGTCDHGFLSVGGVPSSGDFGGFVALTG